MIGDKLCGYLDPTYTTWNEWQKISCKVPEIPEGDEITIRLPTKSTDPSFNFCGVKVYGVSSKDCEQDIQLDTIFTPTSSNSACQIDQYGLYEYEGCFEDSQILAQNTHSYSMSFFACFYDIT